MSGYQFFFKEIFRGYESRGSEVQKGRRKSRHDYKINAVSIVCFIFPVMKTHLENEQYCTQTAMSLSCLNFFE